MFENIPCLFCSEFNDKNSEEVNPLCLNCEQNIKQFKWQKTVSAEDLLNENLAKKTASRNTWLNRFLSGRATENRR